jgi:putative tryptophan/tyrosine transport system substrate-binding protein
MAFMPLTETRQPDILHRSPGSWAPMSFDQLKRREFITLLGGAATWPVMARAQQPSVPVVGFLSSASPDTYSGRVHAFHQGLSENGYVEGRNVAIEFRWAESQNDRLPALVADLVRRPVSVLFADGPSAQQAKAATTTIPIVFSVGFDPVQLKLVASMNRPGGNVTGVTSLNAEVGPKRLELLHELVPAVTIIAALINPIRPTAEAETRDLQAAARTLGLQLHVLSASTDRGLDTAFATLVQLRAGALMISGDAFFNRQSERLATEALRHSVPTIFQNREFAAAGGLMSYGGNQAEEFRTAGIYIGRILKGERPADLPVQQVTKVELIINMKTAKALGLTVPLALLTRADEVIE